MPSSCWLYLAPLVTTLFMTAPASASLNNDCKAAPDITAQIKACTALIKAGEDLASAYRHRGLGHAENGDTGQAIADFNRALELNPKDAATLNNRANLHNDNEEYERALTDYDAAIALDPDYVEAYRNRGSLHLEQRAYDQAIADFDRVIALKPDFVLAYLDRGTAYVNKGIYDQALADFDQALENAPMNEEAHYLKGLAFAWLDRMDDARESIQRAIDIAPGDIKADWADSACWELGTLGRAGLALPYCDQAKAAEHDADLLDSRAFALWQLGDEAGAREELEAAYKQSSNDSSYVPTRRFEEFSMVLVQGLLKGLGYDPRYVDGEPAPETTEAIRSFQQAQGMTVDGKVSDALIAALKAAQAS